MNTIVNKRKSKYDRVMPRVYDQTRSNMKSKSCVTRHDLPSTSSVGAKPSVSNVSSSVFSELPTILNDYIPEIPKQRKFVVKPRKTIRSLDPATSPCRNVDVTQQTHQKVSNIRVHSTPTIYRDSRNWPDTHFTHCYSNRSQTRLKDLKDEIKAYRETDKQMKLRSRLYKNCGVVLNDTGLVAADKAVQAQLTATDKADSVIRSHSRENARAAVSDEQMRSARPRYPVDRYLVDGSKKVEMVNILDGEIWKPEPALKPEDEIILRKLHDMLQSTADDLKLLSGELTKFHEPGFQLKSQPTPLDEKFNEKVHIEEIVNAKFHGYKIIEDTLPFSPESKPKKDFVNKMIANKNQKPKAVNASVQVNSVSSLKKPISSKNLHSTQPKIVHIKDDKSITFQDNTLNGEKNSKTSSTVSYNEIAHKYIDHTKEYPKNLTKLRIQNMPGINIRSELKEQKVLHLSILPDCINNTQTSTNKKNIAVIELQYGGPEAMPPKNYGQEPKPATCVSNKSTVRKVSKILCESSESTNNISSETQQHKIDSQNYHKSSVKTTTKTSARKDDKNKKIASTKKPSHFNLDGWKKKLNSVYGQHNSTKTRSSVSKTKKSSLKNSNCTPRNLRKSEPNTLNNVEYIPYSQLTLGGVRVSDIEREISEFPNKQDLPLSSIVDKILSSKENSFHRDNSHNSPKILTTSDENLLQEVLDIEKTISETLSKPITDNARNSGSKEHHNGSHSEDDKSYVDDFEAENSEPIEFSENNNQVDKSPGYKSDLSREENFEEYKENEKFMADNRETNKQNTTYIKVSNLSFKDEVDIFEFVHSVNTKDTGTQSNTTSKISLKETQTSPRNDRTSIQPIHNVLWPSIDPKGEVEKLFQLEKEFIKKLIVDEYGEILEKNITKPSTSNENDREDWKKNAAALQKNTQTSPAHVKCVMTSPARTKTRTTSPFTLRTVDRQTSPLEASDGDETKILIGNDPEDFAISINLSSPRFSLRLPQNSREVISNLDNCSRTPTHIIGERSKLTEKSKTFRKYAVSSCSSVDADNSSSEMSSLGEMKLKLRKRVRKRESIIATSSSSIVSQSSDTVSGEVLPLKSEGELSLGQTTRKSLGPTESDGELNFEAI